MLKYKDEGHTIVIKLPEECGHSGYRVECRYHFDKKEEKYSLSMHLKGPVLKKTRFKIDYQEIDTQYISGTRENIRQNICRIVEQASLSGFFEDYIQEFERIYRCYLRGSKLESKKDA